MFWNDEREQKATEIGVTVVRITTGLMMLISHGWRKLSNFSDRSDSFPDPLGIGSTFSLSLAVSAEFVCAAALTLGLYTRVAVTPLIINMTVAVFLVHSGDSLAERETALLYLVPFVMLFLTGGGRFCLDRAFELRKT